MKNYTAIFEELEEIGNSRCESSSKAVDIIALMDRFSSYFYLKLALLVLSATEQVSITLQHHDSNAQEALAAVKSAEYYLNRQKSEDAFNLFYDLVLQEAAEKGSQQPTLPRQRKIPRRFDNGGENHTSSPKEFFHCQYFEVLDVLKGELTRFGQPTFAILREMEKISIDSCNDEKNIVLSTEIKTLYANNLDMNELITQLSILSSVIEASSNVYQMGIKSETSVNIICKLFNTCKFPRSMLPEVDKLLCLYYTIPITSATAERTFSTIRRLRVHTPIMRHFSKIISYSFKEDYYVISKLPLQAQITFVALHLTNLHRYNF